MAFRRYPRYHEEWGCCQTCSFPVPVSRLRFDPKYGVQCTGWPGANCADKRPDHDDYLAARRFPAGEGARVSTMPVVDVNEGKGDESGGAVEDL